MEAPKKLTLRRNRYEKETGSQQAASRGENGTKLRESFNRQKDKLKPFMGMYFFYQVPKHIVQNVYDAVPIKFPFRKKMIASYTCYL